MTRLLDYEGRYARSAIMQDAHRRFRDGRRLSLGWSFAQCLSTSWQATRMQRDMLTRRAAA